MDPDIIIRHFTFLFMNLLDGKEEETKIIVEIDNFARDNKMYSRDICEIIVKKFSMEYLPDRKIKIMNLIDSLIKSAGQDYVDQFAPIIADLFKTTYSITSENGKIQLYKIFYTWKYIFPKEMLDQLNLELNMNSMKVLIAQRYPGIFERYDKYNEDFRKMAQRTMMKNTKPPVKENKGNKEKVGLSDDLFSDSSPSISEDNSDQKDRFSNYSGSGYEKSGGSSHRNSFPRKRFKEEEDSRDKRYRRHDKGSTSKIDEEKIQNIRKMKQKIREEKQMQMSGNTYLNHKRNASPMSNDINQSNKQPVSSNGNYNNYIQGSQMNQQMLLKIMSSKIQMNQQGGNNQNLLNQLYMNQQMQSNSIVNSKFNFSPTRVELCLNKYINDSRCHLKTSFPFFSSIAKYFTDTYKQCKILPTSKTNNDLFKSKDLYDQIHKFSYNTLFTNLRNSCAVCGFRTSIYSKFIEHLDIHFHYNYLKHTSKNKVLCRKEGCDKKSWITGSYLKTDNAYTLNAILYYKNDSDYLASGIVNKAKEVKEDNEELIYPVSEINSDLSCGYCGDVFKKKYFAKHHYWFYVNVVKVKCEKETTLVHESCVEEYKNMLSHGMSTEAE